MMKKNFIKKLVLTSFISTIGAFFSPIFSMTITDAWYGTETSNKTVSIPKHWLSGDAIIIPEGNNSAYTTFNTDPAPNQDKIVGMKVKKTIDNKEYIALVRMPGDSGKKITWTWGNTDIFTHTPNAPQFTSGILNQREWAQGTAIRDYYDKYSAPTPIEPPQQKPTKSVTIEPPKPVESTAPINLTDQLQKAVFSEDKDLIVKLLEQGAKVNAKDANGNTSLHRAAASCYKAEIIQTLLDKDSSDINIKNALGFTPLHLAAMGNTEKVVQVLLNKNADKTIKNDNGKTALEMASNNKSNSKEITELLTTKAQATKSVTVVSKPITTDKEITTPLKPPIPMGFNASWYYTNKNKKPRSFDESILSSWISGTGNTITIPAGYKFPATTLQDDEYAIVGLTIRKIIDEKLYSVDVRIPCHKSKPTSWTWGNTTIFVESQDTSGIIDPRQDGPNTATKFYYDTYSKTSPAKTSPATTSPAATSPVATQLAAASLVEAPPVAVQLVINKTQKPAEALLPAVIVLPDGSYTKPINISVLKEQGPNESWSDQTITSENNQTIITIPFKNSHPEGVHNIIFTVKNGNYDGEYLLRKDLKSGIRYVIKKDKCIKIK